MTPRPGSPVKTRKRSYDRRRCGGITPPISDDDDPFGPSIGYTCSAKKTQSKTKEVRTVSEPSAPLPSPSRAVPLHSPQPRNSISIPIRSPAVTTRARLSYSVVNSPSVTPPPNISTRIYQPSSLFETLGPHNESATSTTTDSTELEDPNESTSQTLTYSTDKASGSQTQPATSPQQPSINTSPAEADPASEANLPQLGADDLVPPSDITSVAPSLSS
jgi:hypothetical protein